VRNLKEEACAVAGARITAGGSAMAESLENLEALGNNIVRRSAAKLGDETEPACVVLVRGIVKALSARERHG
jgi:hypothetical protein